MVKKNKRILFSSLIIAVALVAAYFIATFAYAAYTTNQANDRKNRILEIYSSLKIGDGYTVQFENIFGDKRVYSYDKGRSYSSERIYIHPDTVSNTVADLKQKITTAGYTLFDEPYNGGQQHFKSSKNEYIRVSVTSKPARDAFYNNFSMGQPIPQLSTEERNAGPSEVTIKVNLDDNNE